MVTTAHRFSVFGSRRAVGCQASLGLEVQDLLHGVAPSDHQHGLELIHYVVGSCLCLGYMAPQHIHTLPCHCCPLLTTCATALGIALFVNLDHLVVEPRYSFAFDTVLILSYLEQ